MTPKPLISIGIPCFNEELNVIPTYKEIIRVTKKLKKYDFEFIFVDNGSSDKTRLKIKTLVNKDKRVTGVFLSRNFGPEASRMAFLDQARGDAIINLQADLQDPPDLIPKFIELWEKGNNIVIGIYTRSDDKFFISIARKLFYFLFKKIVNIDVSANANSFGLIDKKVLNIIRLLPEKYRFYRGLLFWVGFKRAYIKYQRRKRLRGKSAYNIFDYIKHAERGIFGFSYIILDIMTYFGFLLASLSFILLLIYLCYILLTENTLTWSIINFMIIIFFAGVQLFSISIIGKYIEVIVEETKNRPVYILDKIIRKMPTRHSGGAMSIEATPESKGHLKT